MARIRPINDDTWDSWEPLVAGLPLFLRLILLQYAFAIVAATFLLLGCLKWVLEGRPGPPSSGALRTAIISSGFAVFGLMVWSWLEAYKAKRWAVGFLGICSYAITIACLVLLLTIPSYVRTDFGVFRVDLPLEVLGAVSAIEGVYLFGLRARLIRLGLP